MPRQITQAVLALLGGIVLGAASVYSAPLPVTNPGFEDTSGSALLFNEFSFGSFLGWELYDNPPGLIGNGAGNPFFVGTLQPQPDPANPGQFVFFPDGAPEGTRVAIAYNRVGSGGAGEYGLQQTLAGTPLQANRTYTLEVEVGDIASGQAVSGEVFTLDGFPGYRVDLLAGGQVIASDNNSLGDAIVDGVFATSTVSITTDSLHGQLGQDLGIRLVNLNQVDPAYPLSDLEVDFDNVRLGVEPAVVGDYNFDGVVDAADYTAWRDSLGSTVDLAADGDGDGEITIDDYEIWRQNYGAMLGVSAGQVALAVPEPVAATLLATAWVLVSVPGRK